MEKAEITAGLKSALARGYSLDFAKKSFVNAGYNFQDVEDSAAAIVMGGGSQRYSSSQDSSSVSSAQPTPRTASVSPAYSPQQIKPVSVQPTQPTQTSEFQPLQTQAYSNQQPEFKPLPSVSPRAQEYQRVTDIYGRPKQKGLGLIIVLSIVFILVLGVLGILLFKRDFAESILRSWGLI